MSAFLKVCLFWIGFLGSVGSFREVGDVAEITARPFPFVDPSRCRQPQFCGLSMEWDLKFGRLIDTIIYFPGNSTSEFSDYPGWPMHTIIVAMPSEMRDSYDQLCRSLSSAGNVVVLAYLKNNYRSDFDTVADILRIAFDMYYENLQTRSKFYGILSNQTYIIAINALAERIFYINHLNHEHDYYVHSSIRGIVSISPSLYRLPTTAYGLTNQYGVRNVLQSITIPTLIIAGSRDAHDPIANSKYFYTLIRTGNDLKKHSKNAVCKWYVELQGGNHCFFTDFYNVSNRTDSQCLQKEKETRVFKGTNMTHERQLNTYGAPLLLRYIDFVSERHEDPTNETAVQRWLQYLHVRKTNMSEMDYLGSCFVNNNLHVHKSYFSSRTDLEMYRTFTFTN